MVGACDATGIIVCACVCVCAYVPCELNALSFPVGDMNMFV